MVQHLTGLQIWVKKFVNISEGYMTFQSENILVVTFLYITDNICLSKINDRIGRRNVTLAGVIQTPFDVATK